MPIPTTFFLSSLILDEIKKSWANQNLKKKRKKEKEKRMSIYKIFKKTIMNEPKTIPKNFTPFLSKVHPWQSGQRLGGYFNRTFTNGIWNEENVNENVNMILHHEDCDAPVNNSENLDCRELSLQANMNENAHGLDLHRYGL